MPLHSRAGQPDLFYEVDDFTDPWRETPTIVLQHGYCRNSAFWFQWVPHLCRNMRVIRPDLRGLGKSPRTFDMQDELSLDAYVDDISSLISSVADGPVHYCGESFGGTIGLALAARHSKLVSSLSLVSSPVFINSRAAKGYACGHASWPEAVHAMGPLAWLKDTNDSTRFPPGTSQGFLDWYSAGVAAAGADMMARFAEVALATDLSDELSWIKAPVLMLKPDGGVIADDEQGSLIAAKVKDVRFVTIPSPFHMINFNEPERCAEEVLRFATSVDRGVELPAGKGNRSRA
jgi:3-oxoadipate enol-lactonase